MLRGQDLADQVACRGVQDVVEERAEDRLWGRKHSLAFVAQVGHRAREKRAARGGHGLAKTREAGLVVGFDRKRVPAPAPVLDHRNELPSQEQAEAEAPSLDPVFEVFPDRDRTALHVEGLRKQDQDVERPRERKHEGLQLEPTQRRDARGVVPAVSKSRSGVHGAPAPGRNRELKTPRAALGERASQERGSRRAQGRIEL